MRTKNDISPVAFLLAVQLFCGFFFAVDVVIELYIHLALNGSMSYAETVHLSLESLAVICLFTGYMVARHYQRGLHVARRDSDSKLASLRGHFDDVIVAHFNRWDLTSAECDVALLSLRGLRLSEIAKMRGTSDGTVKAQTSSIFRKAGVRTRSELLGLIMDELLDFGAESDDDGFSNASQLVRA